MVALAVSVEGTGPPLVAVHGFTQTGRSWAPITSRWRATRTVLAVDAPGHGDSAGVRLDLPGTGLALSQVGAHLAPAVDLVGYSMGGRMALHAALAHPERVRRLVLVSATAGLQLAADRAARRAADERLAETIEHGGDGGLPAFVDRWLAGPLFATLPPDARGVDDRLRNTAAGLASSLRLCGTGTQQPLHAQLPSLAMPVLVVCGSLDPKFCTEADVLVAGLPDARLLVVDGAGHSCHLERPEVVAAAVEAFLG